MLHTPASAAAYRRLAATGWRWEGTRLCVQGTWVPLYTHPNSPTATLAVLPSGRIMAV